ncbi:ANTAR domain-containing protein [Streptomyces sp. NPDC001595]|uniref:ANTAR domain-containing protein n=1 Tax=Streptomyces sp. NPDC001532 TaxID=3154520 RepID=UPI0033184716
MRTAESNPLIIEGRTDLSGRARLFARGELVRGCAEALAEALSRLPDTTRRIELDMSGVVFMDTAGREFLELLRDHGERHAIPVAAVNWSGQPKDFWELCEEVEQLRRAMATRPVIDQARGVLMATHACTSEEAWDILREASQLSNTKLRTVAATVRASAEDASATPPEELDTALRKAVARVRGQGTDPSEALRHSS